MESLATLFFRSPPIKNHLKTQKPLTSKPFSLLHKPLSTSQTSNSRETHFPSSENTHILLRNPTSDPLQRHQILLKSSSFFQPLSETHLSFVLSGLITATTTLYSLPCSASESVVSSTEQVSDKINLESILVSIDGFFNRYPFFVAGCTFIWLFVIPVTQGYFRKYKFIYAIDAFRKLRDDPNVQLLDIREEKILRSLKSPNLKILNKSAVQVPFSEDDEDGFVKKVLGNFKEPEYTVVCILDNLDGNSMKVAELLFKNGFKAAYAIKGGVAGKKGWLEIQETLLPPSLHIYPQKKRKASQELGENGRVIRSNEDNGAIGESQGSDHAQVANSTMSTLDKKNGARSSSPYPNYPDLKPPSSPTPSKPSK
ncbi:rhodanese-like domain-containing protein 4A, chloroplastic [Morus notabilis]|nr:rhodanese-like domain-containing protein 4A, chloroplastic [Morus notabilis]